MSTSITPSSSIRVESGFIHVFRFYDIAHEIDLSRVEEIARTLGSSHARIRLIRYEPKSISFEVPPVELNWGKQEMQVGGDILSFDVVVRLYDFGIVSIAFRLDTRDLSWGEYVDLLNRVARSASTQEEWKHAWETLRTRLKEHFADASLRPVETGVEEDYLIAEVRRFDHALDESELQRSLDLVAVLSGESRALSQAARSDLMKNRFSYYSDDLVALTWDRAFVYEPTGDAGVLDILQIANAQLVELRSYDALLDRELPKMHDQIEAAHQTLRSLTRAPYAKLARSLYQLVAEVVEVRERLDNALQVTEDVYLARIHSSAIRLFKVPEFEVALDRKIAIIRDAYNALYDEAATTRSEVLELAIVLLIIFDIVMSFIP